MDASQYQIKEEEGYYYNSYVPPMAAYAPGCAPVMCVQAQPLAAIQPLPILVPATANLPPSPGLPAAPEQAGPLDISMIRRISKALKKKIDKRDHLHLRVSHSSAVFFAAPDQSTWRCTECVRDIGLDSIFKNVHNVGLTSALQNTSCPGCRINPLKVIQCDQCSGCLTTLILHKQAIEEGNIFTSINV